MAWNQSQSDPIRHASKGKRAFSANIGIITVLVIACVVGVGVWLFGGKDKVEQQTTPIPSMKNGVIPEKPLVARPTPSAKPESDEARPKAYWEEDVMPEGLTRAQQQKWTIAHMPPPGITNNTSQLETPPEYACFKHSSENEIAALLTLTPGETLVGEPNYSRWFVRDFKKALDEPVEFSEDDTPNQVELKKAMIELRKELKARMDAGEDLAEVMRETREEYQLLHQYKEDIKSQILEIRRNPDMSEQDMEDVIKAANTMLEEKGIAPIELNPITRRMLRLQKKDF